MQQRQTVTQGHGVALAPSLSQLPDNPIFPINCDRARTSSTLPARLSDFRDSRVQRNTYITSTFNATPRVCDGRIIGGYQDVCSRPEPSLLEPLGGRPARTNQNATPRHTTHDQAAHEQPGPAGVQGYRDPCVLRTLGTRAHP